MINRMVWNNLAHRPVRTGLSVIAVAVEVLLIISTVGLVTGMVDELGRRMKGVGADILVQAPGASFLTGLSSAPMSEKIAGKLEELSAVAVVAPVLIQSSGGLTVIYGVEERFRKVSGGFQVLEGRDLEGGREILVDDIYARDNKIRVGQQIDFWSHPFTVVGVVAHGKGARLFVPLATAQDLNGAQGKVTMFFVLLKNPGQVDPALAEIRTLLKGYNVRSMEEYTSLMSVSNLPGLQPFVRVMIAISVMIGFLVIFLAMYTTVLERTRDIGILKSLGASRAYITTVFLREVGIVAVLGITLGIGGSFLLRRLVLKAVPTLSILITVEWLVWASLIALGGAMIGAFYPALRAARQDPIAALAYE